MNLGLIPKVKVNEEVDVEEVCIPEKTSRQKDLGHDL